MSKHNQNSGGKSVEITQVRLKQLLKYSPRTGEFVRRVTAGPRAVEGTVAGNLHPEGYVRIVLDGKTYQAHRLAFLYMTGRFPKKKVDHKNGLRSDNRWKNLRNADNVQNGRNMKLRRDNTSGIKGVYLSSRGSWKAQACVKGQVVHLGTFDEKEDAGKAYRRFAKRTHGKFYRAV